MKQLLPILAVALFLYAGSVLAAVNINTASAEALTDLPNIGPAKAAAIVKDRKENGAYDSLDELTCKRYRRQNCRIPAGRGSSRRR